MEPLLTEGARRVLDQAEQLARQGGAEAVDPVHLLWALVLDESRAAELLANHDITVGQLELELPLTRGKTDDAEPVETLPHSSLVRDVLHAARHFGARGGRGTEIGSEFLLYGLVEVESRVAEVLRRLGLDPARAGEQAVAAAGHETSSLGVDFHLALPDRTEDERVDTLRLLDAAANRAREGLRVVEDYVRFALDDAHLARLAKNCRHELTAALAPIGLRRLAAARDTLRDVGTTIQTAAEQRRDSPRDVLRANLKRSQEALRMLEEFGKVISPEAAARFQQLRYQAYTLEKAVLTTESSRERLEGRSLYVLVTEEACHHGAGPAIRGAMAGGAGIVQVREKSMPDRPLLEHARRVREWTREGGALLIMNDRPDLAVAADADGVHVGQDELPVREARRIVGPNRLVGVSTHSIEQARQAVLDGADYLGVGPTFFSGTKQFDQLAGIEFVKQVAAEITLPWFAIGGITAGNLEQVIAAGARRIAVSQAVCAAEDPSQEAQKLVAMLNAATSQRP